MNTQSIPPFHNPNNLTPEQYGASEGWRLLRVSEIVPPNAEYFDDRWKDSLCVGQRVNFKFTYRTRTPDPLAAPVDQWVKMSERKPTQADYPAWLYRECGRVLAVYIDDGAILSHWDNWRSISKPTPPARELTQAEKDEAAYRKWKGDTATYGGIDIWNAALAYERARAALNPPPTK